MIEALNPVLKSELQFKLGEAEKNKVFLAACLDSQIFLDEVSDLSLLRGNLRFGIEIALIGLKKDLGLTI